MISPCEYSQMWLKAYAYGQYWWPVDVAYYKCPTTPEAPEIRMRPITPRYDLMGQ